MPKTNAQVIPFSGVVLQNPKYLENLGAAIRACACWDVSQLLWSGARIDMFGRLPREFRMKEYRTVSWIQTERPFDLLAKDVTPVCVELLPGAESLEYFEHPYRAAYIFGPEDGSVSQVWRRLCHKFVQIPSKHCLNLAAAVNVVLYDRYQKEQVVHV